MDNRMEGIFDSLKNHKLTPDSLFMFHCTMCGECCRNRDDILLSPQDLFKLAQGLKMTPIEVVKKYCDLYIGQTSRIPIVRLKSIGFDKHCVFLNEKLCSVQEFKPTVCALFPIGRAREIDPKTHKAKNNEISYLFTNPQCGDKREIHSVREWLGNYSIPLDDESFFKWTDTANLMSAKINELEKHLSEKALSQVWNVVFGMCYCDYDLDKEFLPQFIKNCDLICEALNKLCSDIKGGH